VFGLPHTDAAVALRARFLPGLLTLCFGVAVAVCQTTTWGGDHVRLDVTKTGADLDFDCAHGTITGAIPETGTFKLKGTFTPERSGPARDDAPRDVPATYAGTITQDSMALRIEVDGNTKDALTYMLSRGSMGKVRKCR
jgi:hypothetical protein